MSKIALITGAARGIGLASSKKFSAQGYEVLMLDRDETELENAVQEVPVQPHFVLISRQKKLQQKLLHH